MQISVDKLGIDKLGIDKLGIELDFGFCPSSSSPVEQSGSYSSSAGGLVS